MSNKPPSETLSIRGGEIDERLPSLRVIPDGGTAFTVLLAQRIMNIGADAQQDITINTPGVDRRHARLVQEGTNYRVYDLTEYNGVLLNNKPVEGSALLKDSDVVRLQDKTGRGVTLNYSNPIERALGSESVGRVYPLDKSPYIIGRDPNASIHLDALSVSWHHAQITEQGGAHILSDLGSQNGTFVNDRALKGEYRLRPEDVIRIDQALFVYKGKALMRLAATQRFEMEAVNIEMTYRTGLIRKRELNTMREVALSIKPKEFVAVIGGSGSGKSTLLRALNGANRATGGQVMINGRDFYENYELYQPIIGYVPQTDIVQDSLTVYQSLVFGARLRFPNEPEASREQRIERVLSQLELSDFRDRLVGRLSGGQKKRVSIALELMAEPGLLFMDEPSSGLDPGLDKSMMEELRKLANRGHIVAVVTHTTLNIELCDFLVFMARGYLVYFGPPKGALDFFGARDYSEIYNRVQQSPEVAHQQAANMTMVFNAASASGAVSKEKISAQEAAKRWAEKFRTSDYYAKFVKARLGQQGQEGLKQTGTRGESALTNKSLRGSRRGTFIQQARVLTERTIALVKRDTRTIIALLLILPLVGLFLGLISRDPIENSRGKMMVSRGSSSDYVVLLDKLALDPVATAAPAPGTDVSPTPSAAATPEATATPRSGSSGSSSSRTTPQVRGVGTFSPASEAQRLLFIVALAVTLFGIFASAYTVVVEKSLFLRERMVNLRIMPYLASKVVVYTALSLVSCVLLMITLSVGVELPAQGLILPGVLEIFVTMALTAAAGVSIGLFISAISKQTNAVTYTVLAVLFLQILFPGVLFKMDGALEPLSRLTVTRWSLEALGGTANMVQRNAEGRIVVETIPVNPKTGQPLPNAPSAKQYFPAPPALNVTYPITPSDLVVRWGVLLLFSVVFLGAASLALNRSESF
ncbi:ABC transporter ATP-binding/permease protein [Anaerolineae bacterium]|nr:ABC transporter ATP-binding/permease protein [Anaerolineae bacterium]